MVLVGMHVEYSLVQAAPSAAYPYHPPLEQQQQQY